MYAFGKEVSVLTTSVEWAENMTRNGLKVRHVSMPTQLLNSDYKSMIREYAFNYANIFELSSDDTEELIQFLLRWDILRVCCGMQMSAKWRRVLERGRELQNGSNELCRGNIDIGAQELSFLSLTLTSQIKARQGLKEIPKPSNVDDELDGTYCERYRSFVKTKRSGHNVRISQRRKEPDKKKEERSLIRFVCMICSKVLFSLESIKK